MKSGARAANRLWHDATAKAVRPVSPSPNVIHQYARCMKARADSWASTALAEESPYALRP
jgi:hypothetical protein